MKCRRRQTGTTCYCVALLLLLHQRSVASVTHCQCQDRLTHLFATEPFMSDDQCTMNRWVGRETDSSGQVTWRNTVWCWFISVPVGQEHRETYLLVSCWSCLYSFTKLVYKQTNILLILDQIKEDPITLSIYVIAGGWSQFKVKTR